MLNAGLDASYIAVRIRFLTSDPQFFNDTWRNQVSDTNIQMQQIARRARVLTPPPGWEDVHAAWSSGLDHLENAARSFDDAMSLAISGDVPGAIDLIHVATSGARLAASEIEQGDRLMEARTPRSQAVD